ncbi:DUF1240 domain-containing protein [Trabulsiella odontotermitis]|uniref:Uncharacterized protein n=1 Tax=Trabulsiella odontotermitis TaxID=379893 RepID=A0A0L0GMI0_9ENTR|nr:hypothetical protein GM31_05205 [Trabulsiella odontotermitis]
MDDFISLIKMEAVISYNKTCLLMSGIPMLSYFVLLTFFYLFSEKIFKHLQKLMDSSYFILLMIIPIPVGYISTIIIPFILMANSYTNCPQENLSSYYVKDVALCEKIKRRDLF